MRGVFRAAFVSAALILTWTDAASAELVQSPGIAATEQQVRLARQLIDLIHPDQLMLESNLKSWEAVSRKTAANDAVFAKLEAAYPGVTEAAIANARPAATEYAREFVRKSKQAKVRIFADSLDAAELKQLIDFFEQPAGQRFSRSMGQTDAVVDDLAAKKETSEKLTQQDLNDMLGKQMKSTVKTMSADDMLAIMKFESLPVAKKFAAAGQEADRAILEIINNPDPAWLEKQQQAVADGATRFVESARAARK